jgi:hypothetical protein
MEETSAHSDYEQMNDAKDYYTSAQRELTVREQSAGLIKTTQDLSSLIRDLQELWLFGGLDTLEDKKNEDVVREREKAGRVAEMIERLAKGRSVGGTESKGENGVKEEEGRKDG